MTESISHWGYAMTDQDKLIAALQTENALLKAQLGKMTNWETAIPTLVNAFCLGLIDGARDHTDIAKAARFELLTLMEQEIDDFESDMANGVVG